MKKVLLGVVLLFLLSSFKLMAQNWQYAGPWPDTTYKGGSHGIVVDPDGKIWTASYYKTNWHTPSGDDILTSPILVFNPDGSLLDTIQVVIAGANSDTLGYNPSSSSSGCRGLGLAADGNILYVRSGPTKIIKINYQTLEGMAIHNVASTEIGSSPTRPSASNDGTIYVGPVVGGGTSAIATYDNDLNYTGSAVDAPPAIARSMMVSKDGLTIYWTTFTGEMGMWIYSRQSDLDPFALTDSLFTTVLLNSTTGMSIESIDIRPNTGVIYVSNDSRGNPMFTNQTWYGLDPTTYEMVDSLSLPNIQGADNLPRAMAFSNDGNTAYVGLFGSAFNRIYKFEHVTNVDEKGQVVIDGYKLSQNYPNPFNPSTKITFQLPMSGYATLKVYDMLGEEIATLVQGDMESGVHSIDFNASNLASGTYIYQLNVNGNKLTNKMILLK
jgi:hypothetical protein